MKCIVMKRMIGVFVLMCSLVLPPSSFALSASDFDAMVQKAEERRVAIAQMMEASTVFIVSKDNSDSFGMGTGFIIKENYVLTNAHVVDNYKRFFIAGKDFAPIEATLVKKLHTDVDDFALLKFNQPSGLPVLSFSLSLSRTDKVSAWGYPYLVTQFDQNMDKIIEGKYAKVPPVVYTEGVVSAFVEANGGQAIIHSAAIAAGNSGGPLINTHGQVVGINTWGATIEGDGAFVNASLPAHAAIKFLRSCDLEPTIAESTGPILALQTWTPAAPFYAEDGNGGSSGAGYLPSYLRGNSEAGAPSPTSSPDANKAPAGKFPSEQAAAQLTGEAKALYANALAGDAEAQAYIGISYYLGDEAPELEDEGVYWLQQAVAQNNATGQYNLGIVYIENDTFKNVEEGLKLLRKASQQEAVYACGLARFLLRGEAYGVPRDAKAGFEAAQRGAEAGDPEAISLLAYAYAMGFGVDRDEEYALELAQAAADEGDVFGHALLGFLHCASIDLPENLDASLEHAKIAADEGNAMGYGVLSMHAIFDNYPDLGLKKAREMAEEGAAHGDETAQFVMGLFFVDEDLGGEVDLSQSWAYFEMAARNNFSYAAELRDELAEVLSEQDIKLGKQYIELWRSDWGL